MNADNEQFLASDGYSLAITRWKPAEHPRGGVVALHGIQSHAGWYDSSSRRLAQAGFDVRFLDRRGSGRNSEDRGHATHADRLVNDVIQVLQFARSELGPELPLTLLSVSWGGRLAATVAAERPELLDGLVLLYPGIFPRIGPTWWQSRQLDLAEWLGIRHKRIPIPLDDPALFTAVPEWQEFIRTDPLTLRDVTTAFLSAHRDLGRRASLAAPRLVRPVLMMLAGRDRIIDNAATERFFSEIAAADKRLITCPDAAHTLEFEPDRDKLIDDLHDWLCTVRRAKP